MMLNNNKHIHVLYQGLVLGERDLFFDKTFFKYSENVLFFNTVLSSNKHLRCFFKAFIYFIIK